MTGSLENNFKATEKTASSCNMTGRLWSCSIYFEKVLKYSLQSNLPTMTPQDTVHLFTFVSVGSEKWSECICKRPLFFMLATQRFLQENMWPKRRISYFLWNEISVLHKQKVFTCYSWEIVVSEVLPDFLWGPRSFSAASSH